MKKVLIAFVLGLGIAIPLTLGGIYQTENMYFNQDRREENAILSLDGFGLEISEVRAGPFEEETVGIYGTVKNVSRALVRDIRLEAELYDVARPFIIEPARMLGIPQMNGGTHEKAFYGRADY